MGIHQVDTMKKVHFSATPKSNYDPTAAQLQNAYNSYSGNPYTKIDDNSVTQYSSKIEFTTSIFGPTATPQKRAVFLGIISLMTFCGANNDFLGKLCYQSLPGEYSGYDELRNRYWIAWLLTFGTFLTCSGALICGWNGGKDYNQMRNELSLFIRNVSVPGIFTNTFLSLFPS